MCNENKQMIQNPNLIEEYKVLQDEIKQNAHIIATVVLANFSIIGVIFVFGFENESSSIFLSPLAILIPSIFFITSKLESTTRIASYIKVFIEPELDLKWEKRWFQIREKELIPHKLMYTGSLAGLYGTLSIICLMLALNNWTHSHCIFFVLFFTLGIPIVFGIISLHKSVSTKFIIQYNDLWNKLKTKEKIDH